MAGRWGFRVDLIGSAVYLVVLLRFVGILGRWSGNRGVASRLFVDEVVLTICWVAA